MTEEAEEFIEKIDDLREDDRFKFADEILRGIRQTVKDANAVTSRQRQAIANITESVNKGFEKTWSRRYEGHQNEK